MPAGDVTINALFVQIDYSITAAQTAHGSVTAPASAHYEDTITLTVQPDAGYSPESLTVTDADGNEIEVTDNQFNMPAGDVTINALFVQIDYSITAAQTAHGSVTAPASAHYEDTITLTVQPDAGYSPESLTVTDEDGNEIEVTDNQFTMPAGDVTINASFVQNDYSITVADTAHCSVSVPATAHYEDTVTLNVQPDEGYWPETLTVTDADGNAIRLTDNGDNTYRFTMPASAVTVTAVYVYVNGGHPHTDANNRTILFQPWTSTNNLPSSGSYYLTGNVIVSEETFVDGDLNLCLNGKTITCDNGNNAFTVYYRGSLSLYDEAGDLGVITGGTVSGNTAAYAGDNIDLCENHNINITGSLGDHVYEVALTDYRGDYITGVFTDGLSGKGTAANFTNGNREKYILTLNDDGEAELVFNSAHYEEDGDTVILHDATGWELFCDLLEQNEYGYYTGKTVKMGDSFTITRMAGRFGQKFTGTFDGNGKTLTVDLTAAIDGSCWDCAPFYYAENATFQNMRVVGSITTAYKFAAGIVSFAKGTANITNCICSVTINSSVDGGGNHGGFVGKNSGGKLTFTGCVFNGRIIGEKTDNIGDIITLSVNGAQVKYSPLNYCKNAIDGGTDDENLINVAKAVYHYWKAADRYFNANIVDLS